MALQTSFKKPIYGGIPTTVSPANAGAAKPAAPAEPPRPTIGSYQGAANAQGQLKSAYQIKDPGAVQSPWMNMMKQQMEAAKTTQLNQAAAQGASGAAQAQAMLARKGGLSSGSAERIAQGAADQSALNMQNVRGAADQAAMQGQIQDMQGERQYQTGLQQANVQTALQDLGNRQNFDLTKYQEQMKQYGADKTAEATKKSSGSVICTALRDVGIITPYEHRCAGSFRHMVDEPTYLAYLRWGRPVASAIRALPVLGYFFLPLVRYWMGQRNILDRVQFAIFKQFNKLFKKGSRRAVQI
jgi:hypothetical protein